jgi:hypothetical protein
MELYGNGRVVLLDDPATAGRLEWPVRKRSAPEPEIRLAPAAGDPALEPWICQGRAAVGTGPRALWEGGGPEWTYLAGVPGLDRYLKAMAEPRKRQDFVVGISGLGRVGGLAASALAAADRTRTRIDTLLLHDCDRANLERMRQELAAVASWRSDVPLPRVEAVALPELLRRCDAFLFAAARAVPPLGAQGDVRLPQYEPNHAALSEALDAAQAADYTGLFFVVSDPVELLAQASFHDSNAPGGAFLGRGLAPERVAGLALGIMWGRALAQAEAAGEGARVALRGVPYGPHSTDVLVFDDPADPDPALSAAMTQAARTGNYRVRDLGFIPFIGPALSSIALTLPALLGGREVLASSFLDGIYFGAPCRLRWGLAPTRRQAAPAVQRQVEALHGLVKERMAQYGLSFTAGHPAV